VHHELQARLGGQWVVVSEGTAEESLPGIRIYLVSGTKHVLMRDRLDVSADQFSRGSTATSKVFEIG
jgi:hypothetical protein